MVSDNPFTRFDFDRQVFGGDASVFDGKVVAPDNATDSDIGSGS